MRYHNGRNRNAAPSCIIPARDTDRRRPAAARRRAIGFFTATQEKTK
jgi:hypothetical protein